MAISKTAIDHRSFARHLVRAVKPQIGRLANLWRAIAPVRVLTFLGVFHLSFSFAYIVVFSRSFNFGSRIIVLHLAVVAGLMIIAALGIGSLLSFKWIREWRFTRLIIALSAVTGFSVLLLLYFTDYIGNSLWGNNVNYELVSKYLSGGGIFQKELRILPGKTYLLLISGLVVIFTTYVGLSKPLFRELAELFSRGGEASQSQDRRWAPKWGLVICLLLFGLAGYQATRVGSPYRERILQREPLISFFTNANGLDDFVSYSVRTRLEAEDDRVRASYPAGQSFERKNVIMIMVDSLRADHMQVYGYERATTPFLSGLLKTGHLRKVETATSACSDTNCGVLATLSSKLLGSQIQKSFKLQDVLHKQGYSSHFILAGSHRWYNLESAYGTGFTYYFDGASSAKYDWNDDRVIFEGLDKMRAFDGAPSFFYFHVLAPHSKAIKQEKYQKYLPAKNWVEFSKGEFDTTLLTNYYDNGVVQADAVIKEIFESLGQKGYLSNSLVVILGDHGEALGQLDHAYYGHVNHLYQECISIPLLIYDESPTKYTNLAYATQIDVAPTVLDRLGLAIPSSWQGQSLLTPDSRQYTFHQTKTFHSSYAVIYRTDRSVYKYLRHYALGEELYELMSDPREKHNLIGAADPAIVNHLRGKLTEGLSEHWATNSALHSTSHH